MAASSYLDAIGHLPGRDLSVVDAEGAYTQAPMLEEETWVALPEEAIPSEFETFAPIRRPIVNLR